MESKLYYKKLTHTVPSPCQNNKLKAKQTNTTMIGSAYIFILPVLKVMDSMPSNRTIFSLAPYPFLPKHQFFARWRLMMHETTLGQL